ncbi:MAG: hypothetical protein PHE43_01510 [Candidatus Nanoarchaeia archaeon]|nr:hypothetical protein [Candidatus Nanoarchaeia archaeon]
MISAKLFFETSVILGAAQYKLLESNNYLKMDIEKGLISKPERYKHSYELIEYVMKKKGELDPFVSYGVKREIRNLLQKKEQLEKKIIEKLKLPKRISKLPIEDKKVFDYLLFQIFFVKFPSITYDILDQFGSIAVDDVSVEGLRDELFSKIFKPLKIRQDYLIDYFERKGVNEGFLIKDKDYPEYQNLKKLLEPFYKFGNYKKINDLRILAEAIYCYNKMKDELKITPTFYFVSCDHIFIPFRGSDDQTFFKVHNEIKAYYGLEPITPKEFLLRASSTD